MNWPFLEASAALVAVIAAPAPVLVSSSVSAIAFLALAAASVSDWPAFLNAAVNTGSALSLTYAICSVRSRPSFAESKVRAVIAGVIMPVVFSVFSSVWFGLASLILLLTPPTVRFDAIFLLSSIS